MTTKESIPNKAYLDFLKLREAFKGRVKVEGFERSYGSEREHDEKPVEKILERLFPDREIGYDGEHIALRDDLDMPDMIKLNGIEFSIRDFWYDVGDKGLIKINYNSKKFTTDNLTKLQEARVNKILTSLGYVHEDFFKHNV